MKSTVLESATRNAVMPRGITADPPPPPAADGDAVVRLPLDRVRPHPFNPRKSFDEDYLQELAESIREKGVLQPITVRPVAHGPVFGDDIADHYAIVMGECRWRASRLAGMTTIRALIEEMDDREHKERAIIENIQRRQLNPMDEARGYQALREMDMSVTEIAAKVGRGQPAVSKSLALLSLPESAQGKISGGELSVSQALVIKKYDAHPAVVEALATATVRDKIASHTLEKGLPRSVTSDLKKSKKASEFAYDDHFRHEVCARACPFAAYVKDEWGNHLCLKPEHLRELRAQQKQAQAEKDATTLACAQAAGILPRLADMSRSTYEVVGTGSCPAGCTEACPCRSRAKSNYGSDVVQICTDPTRYQAFQAEDKKRREAEEEAHARSVQAQVSAVLARLDIEPETFDGETRQDELQRRCTALALKDRFHGVEIDEVKRAAKALGLTLDYQDYDVYSLKFKAFMASLARHDVKTQIRLATEITFRRQIERLRKGYPNAGVLEWLLSEERIPAVWEDAERAASESAPTPASEAEPAAGTVIGGVLLRTEISEDGDEARCAGCSQWAGVSELHNRKVWQALDGDPSGVLHSLFGAVVTPQGMVYCTDCGPSVLYCRECGCTNEAGCDLGGGETCCWTEPDLCSGCATRDETPGGLAGEVSFADGEPVEVGA